MMRSGRPRFRVGLVGSILVVVITAGLLGPVVPVAAAERPNVVLIVTDDQRWDSLWAMPNVRELLAGRGVTFTDAVVSNPLCCPSRAAILTGSYSHTNDVWRNNPPHGGFESFDDTSTIATWLDDSGYRTGLFGKYMNGYGRADPGYVPPGWDRWFAFRNAAYYGYEVNDDGRTASFGDDPAEYSTSVVSRRLLGFVGGGSEPFFALFAPFAPHRPSIPAPGDDAAFTDAGLPPSRAFDEEDVSDKPAWVRSLARIREAKRADLVEDHRDALRSLLAVDRAVGALVRTLEAQGRLRDTVIIFTSDNGLALGEHRWTSKRVPYEPSIRVPLVVRADTLGTDGGTNDDVVANVDLAPTIAALAGVTAPPTDGLNLTSVVRDPSSSLARNGVLLEHLAKGGNVVPSYCGVRTDRQMYVRYATGEEELYDLRRDPDQLRNSVADVSLRSQLDALRARARARCTPPDDAFRWGS